MVWVDTISCYQQDSFCWFRKELIHLCFELLVAKIIFFQWDCAVPAVTFLILPNSGVHLKFVEKVQFQVEGMQGTLANHFYQKQIICSTILSCWYKLYLSMALIVDFDSLQAYPLEGTCWQTSSLGEPGRKKVCNQVTRQTQHKSFLKISICLFIKAHKAWSWKYSINKK